VGKKPRTNNKKHMPTVTFNHTGAAQSWVVPANVHTIAVEAWGAQGGSGSGDAGGSLAPGAEGGFARGLLEVTPGETLHVYVGGQGQNVTIVGPVGGGFNGGGGAGGAPPPQRTRGGGGGGSDVRQGGNSVANRKIVAGGGGGTSGVGFLGGVGGGMDGGDGSDASLAGLGGTQNAGGAANQPLFCNPGDLFAGGNTISTFFCSGGGGGLYGGGAGGGAGGGSGYVGGVLGGFTSQGGRQGNGLVIFSFGAALQCPKDVCIVTSRCSFPVYYAVKGEGTGEIICTPPSGSCFPQGTTRVDCYAQLNRSVKCYFFVTVRPR
jgi:hypothetical protein